MNKTWIFAAFIICLWLDKRISFAQQSDHSIINIDFQNNFKNDIVDIKVNDVPVISHRAIESTYVGFTNLSLKITSANENKYKITYLDKFKYCRRTTKIKLYVKLNGMEHVYDLDPHNGKWVGLGKDKNNTIVFTQQNEGFIYE